MLQEEVFSRIVEHEERYSNTVCIPIGVDRESESLQCVHLGLGCSKNILVQGGCYNMRNNVVNLLTKRFRSSRFGTEVKVLCSEESVIQDSVQQKENVTLCYTSNDLHKFLKCVLHLIENRVDVLKYYEKQSVYEFNYMVTDILGKSLTQSDRFLLDKTDELIWSEKLTMPVVLIVIPEICDLSRNFDSQKRNELDLLIRINELLNYDCGVHLLISNCADMDMDNGMKLSSTFDTIIKIDGDDKYYEYAYDTYSDEEATGNLIINKMISSLVKVKIPLRV